MSNAAGPLHLPYFDLILQQLEAGEPRFQEAFGNHVHWGYWPDPRRADGSVADFSLASERLCGLVMAGAQLADGRRVLDAGCGFGGTVASLNGRWSDLELVGVNLDGRQLERAAARVRPRSGNRIRWICADACALPPGLGAGEWDAVLAVECIFHFPSRDAFFEQCSRLLRPGGRLALSDFVPAPPLALLRGNRPDFSAAPSGLGGWVTSTYGPVDCSCSRQGYRQLAQRHGLKLVVDQDITRGTLPTYALVADLFRSVGELEAARATDLVAWMGRLGLLQYRVMAFERL
jgi:SAM-dependent methyltransferase